MSISITTRSLTYFSKIVTLIILSLAACTDATPTNPTLRDSNPDIIDNTPIPTSAVITLEPAIDSISVGESAMFTATRYPPDNGWNWACATEDTTTATVITTLHGCQAMGKVPGAAIITAHPVNDDNAEPGTARLVVTEPPPPPPSPYPINFHWEHAPAYWTESNVAQLREEADRWARLLAPTPRQKSVLSVAIDKQRIQLAIGDTLSAGLHVWIVPATCGPGASGCARRMQAVETFIEEAAPTAVAILAITEKTLKTPYYAGITMRHELGHAFGIAGSGSSNDGWDQYIIRDVKGHDDNVWSLFTGKHVLDAVSYQVSGVNMISGEYVAGIPVSGDGHWHACVGNDVMVGGWGRDDAKHTEITVLTLAALAPFGYRYDAASAPRLTGSSCHQ